MRTFAGAISAPSLPRTEVVVQSFGGLFCGARLNDCSGRDASVRPLAFLNRDCFDRLMARASGSGGGRAWSASCKSWSGRGATGETSSGLSSKPATERRPAHREGGGGALGQPRTKLAHFRARARNSRNSRPSRCFYGVSTVNAEGEDEGSQFSAREELKSAFCREKNSY